MSSGNSVLLRGSRCYISLACSIGSISLACGSVFQIPNTTDRISLQRGAFLTSLGFIYFISLTDFCNKYLLDTRRGKVFRQKYHLMISDVMEITNKVVSIVQAVFSFLVGLVVCKSTCSKTFVYASHCLMEAYGWFGTAYFMYDLWSMYKVDTQTIADKLKRIGGLDALNGKDVSSKAHNELYDKSEMNAALKKDTKDNGNGNGNAAALMPNGDSNSIPSCQSDVNVNVSEDECKGVPFTKDAWDFLVYMVKNPMIVIHHIFIGTFGLLVLTYIRGGGHCIYSYIYMMEFSTPFVSLRSILSTMGLKKTRAYVINGLLMLGTFFVCRIYMWPHVMWHYSAAINKSMWEALVGLPRGCLISISILLFPQLYWFYLMLKGAVKVLILPPKPTKNSENHSKNNNLSPTDDAFRNISKQQKERNSANSEKLTQTHQEGQYKETVNGKN